MSETTPCALYSALFLEICHFVDVSQSPVENIQHTYEIPKSTAVGQCPNNVRQLIQKTHNALFALNREFSPRKVFHQFTRKHKTRLV